jgi:hypothetical protein
MEERNGPLMAGTGLEKKRTEALFSFSSATAGPVSLFSTFFSLMVKKEGKRLSRIPDLFARKRVYLGQRHCAYKRLAARTQNCSPFSFFWLKKERKGINGTWGRHSDGRALGGAESAGCVRRLDGSLVPARKETANTPKAGMLSRRWSPGSLRNAS